MRLKKSIINTSISILSQLIILIISFVSRTIFMNVLGIEVLGVHGFLSNIISWLSLADLGIGNAVCYALYEPIEKNDINLLSAFYNFLKKLLRYISIVYIAIIVIILPFVVFSCNKVLDNLTIISVFLIWSVNQLLSLFIYYNAIILIADQKVYKTKGIYIFISIITSLCQIFILLKYQNYFWYTAIMLIFTSFQYLFQKIVVQREYPYLKNSTSLLNLKIKSMIFMKTRSLMLHGIGDFILNSTDNIIIINVLGARISGIFSNYHLIFSTLQALLNQIVTGMVSSVGNYLVTESREKSYEMFLNISLLSNIIFAICAVCGALLANEFIIIWYNKPIFLDDISIILLSLNLFIMGLRCGPQIFRNAAALYERDRYIRLFFALSNLLLSFVFSKFCGISGILFATTLNLIGEELIVLPLLILKKELFRKTIKEYYYNLFRSIFAYVFSIAFGKFIIDLMNFNNLILDFIFSGFILSILTFLVFVVFHIRTKEMKYLFALIKSKVLS